MNYQAILKRFWDDEGGAESVEWPLIVGILVVVVVVGYIALKSDISTGLSKIGNTVANPPAS